MSDATYQLQFAAELVAMLVAAAGLVLVALRPDLTGAARWARAAVAVGFMAAGAAAFVHGSLLSTTAEGTSTRVLSALRLAGYLTVGAGVLRWRGGTGTRLTLWAGLVVAEAAAVIALAGGPARVADIALIVGNGGVAAGLVLASNRLIVARVAAGTVAVLLVMVLVISVALSSVITNSVQQNKLSSLATRARVEGDVALAGGSTALKDARFVAADLQGYFREDAAALLALHASPDAPAAAAAVRARLAALAALYPGDGLGYVAGPHRSVVSVGAASAQVDAVAAAPLIRALDCATSARALTVTVAGSALVLAAAYPLCLAPSGTAGSGPDATLLGAVVVASPLDAGYLAGRQRVDPSSGLALVAEGRVVAAAGAQPPGSVAAAIGGDAVDSRRSVSGGRAGWELAAEPLAAGPGRPVAALVVAAPAGSVTSVRQHLERTLFLIALGATLIALLLVAAIGERITAGLRRLTGVADRIRRGDTGERAGITTRDEVGRLGAAFDSMVSANEEQTAALQIAAEDEARLRNRLQAVVAGMGDALVATDPTGRVVEFNAAAETLTGVAAVGALGRPARDVLDLVGDDGTRLGPRLDRQATTWTELARLYPSGGEEIPVAVSAGVLRGPGEEPAGAVLVLRDLRRERELEQMKSEFLSRVGHELRTPLTAILGYSEILATRRSTPAQTAAWAGEVASGAKRLARVVELLEFFASSGAGRVVLDARDEDPAALLRDLTDRWALRIDERHSIGRRVARGTPMVRVDRRWMSLALDELVDNALKFSPGGGRVLVTAAPVPGQPAVDFTVTDRGMGMTAAEQAAAFGEFVQSDASDTRRFGGLGLGLALVQRVVDGLGGSVHCESSPGAGSRFTARVPAAADTDNGTGASPAAAMPAKNSGE